MYQLIVKIIESVPKKFLLTILALLVGWFGFLSYIAFFTNRNVEFFPPKVGTDKVILSEIQLLTHEVRELQGRYDRHLVYLREQLAHSRDRAASEKSYSISRPEGYEEACRKWEKDIEEFEQKYSADLKNLLHKVQSLEQKLM